MNVVTVGAGSSGVRVTAVLPTFNRRSSLGAAVDSVLTQTMVDLELIIVDDASDVETRPDPGSFGDPRVRVLRREVNGGVAAAQNTGLRAASGEFVAFIHSDDQWLPAKLEHQLDVLGGADPDCVGVESATRRVHAGSSVVGPRLAGRTHEDLLARRVKNLHLSGFLFRRELLLESGGFDEDLRAYEDLDVLIRLSRRSAFLTSDEVVSVVDQSGSDRLAASSWMQQGREHLVSKYETELLSTFGELPSDWQDWSLQAGLASLSDGRAADARRYVAQSVGSSWRRRLRRAPLVGASYCGARVGRLVAAKYTQVLQRDRRVLRL